LVGAAGGNPNPLADVDAPPRFARQVRCDARPREGREDAEDDGGKLSPRDDDRGDARATAADADDDATSEEDAIVMTSIVFAPSRRLIGGIDRSIDRRRRSGRGGGGRTDAERGRARDGDALESLR
jgi:hypothetical protein